MLVNVFETVKKTGIEIVLWIVLVGENTGTTRECIFTIPEKRTYGHSGIGYYIAVGDSKTDSDYILTPLTMKTGLNSISLFMMVQPSLVKYF